MLQFFRKYQKFFFLFVTIIIVTTFVFFGTYQAFAPGTFKNKEDDEVLFKTADQTAVKGSYLKALSYFLRSENWMSSPRAFSVNFLNEGVVSNEFLETDVLPLICPSLGEEFTKALEDKSQREKNYQPYTHSHFSFLSAESIWGVFAPEIPEKLQALKSFENFADRKALEARVRLFLAEKKFPASFLAQVIHYQIKDNPSFAKDPQLAHTDFSLFGYHDLADWFTEPAIDAFARVVIHTAALARQKGYRVSKAESLSEILYKSQKMYETLKEKFDLPFSDGYGLLQHYLRQNGLNEEILVKLWGDLSLFKKFVHEVGNAALVDLLCMKKFYAFAHENATIELCQMPQELRFQNVQDLKRFETYLAAVSEKKHVLDVPSNLLPLATIENKAPELIGKKYRIYCTEVSKNSLQSKVGVKETWEWENTAENWKLLTEQYPELAQKTGEPLEILESVDPKLRKLADSFARKEIVKTHPEWIEEAFKASVMEEKEFFLSSSSKMPLKGISDRAAFEKMLEENTEVFGYTQDEEIYYRILVQEKSEKAVMTFKEALQEGDLDAVSERLEIQQETEKVIEKLAALYGVEKDAAFAYRFKEFLEADRFQEFSGDLALQWKTEKKEKTLTRSDPSFIAVEEALGLTPESCSQVAVDLKEGTYYFKLKEKKVDTTIPLDKVVKIQDLLSIEARRHVFENLVKRIPFN